MSITYTPTTVNSGFNVTEINANFTAIQTALSRAIDRGDTAGGNAMQQNLDLGTNDIINGGVGNFSDIIVAGSSVAASAAAAAASAAAAAISESNAATSESNASTSETNAAASAVLASQWATLTGSLVAATDYSAKEYAVGTTVAAGSAKLWATEAEDVLVNATEYSAFHWAQKASAASGGNTVKVSSNDTTATYLINKLAVQHGLSLTETNDGGDEDVTIGVGSHLEIGGGANNYELNVYTGDSLETVAHFTNLTTGNTSTDGTKIGINSAEQAVLWNYENTAMLFGVNNDEKMRLTTNGNLLFDTTSDASGYRIRCHDASGSGAQYIRFGNTTTGTLTSRGIVVGMNASEQMVIQNLENTHTLFYTNNALRWTISNAGGLYANGATGGDQGLGTINAEELFVDGRSVSGSTPTTSNKYKRTNAKFVVDYGFDTAGILTAIDVGTAWTKNTWESFGPTGSGATNIVADLDVVNDMGACSAYEFSVHLSGLANTAAAYNQYVEYTMDAAHATQAYVGRHGSYNGSGGSAAVSAMGMGGTFSANDDGVGEIRWNSTNCTSEAIYLIIHAIHEGEGN